MEAIGSSSKNSSSKMVTMKARFQRAVEEVRSKEMDTVSMNFFFVFVRIFVERQWRERGLQVEGIGRSQKV